MNMNKKENNLIVEMQQILRKPKLTMENMIFSDVNEDEFDNEDDIDDEEDFQDSVINKDNNVTEDINKIRQIALQAIAKLANDPTSEQYQLLKKVWNIVDKAFETKENNKSVENM